MSHFGNLEPNFSVSKGRVLDHLRVRQPNTFKLPPAAKNLIDPNVVNDDDKLVGDNNPVTNSTLRSGVAQAGALVYCTTPIVKPPLDSCEAYYLSSTIVADDGAEDDFFVTKRRKIRSTAGNRIYGGGDGE